MKYAIATSSVPVSALGPSAKETTRSALEDNPIGAL